MKPSKKTAIRSISSASKAMPPPDQTVAAAEFLVFGVCREEYAVNVEQVQELRGYEHVTSLANSADDIKGVINLRGTIVPLIDMRIRLGDDSPTYDGLTVVIILNLDQATIGMVVDSVSDVLTLTHAQIKPAPQVGSSMKDDYLMGIGTLDDRMLILIDVNRMISGAEAGMIQKMAA